LGRAEGLFVQIDQMLRHHLSIYVAEAVYMSVGVNLSFCP
jgi:hypothetical protein